MTTTPVAGEVRIVALPVGTRIRDPRHPELTGKIAGYEWNSPGVLSAIPYKIAWDNPDRAYDLRGWFYYWATPGGIEEIVEHNTGTEPK